MKVENTYTEEYDGNDKLSLLEIKLGDWGQGFVPSTQVGKPVWEDIVVAVTNAALKSVGDKVAKEVKEAAMNSETNRILQNAYNKSEPNYSIHSMNVAIYEQIKGIYNSTIDHFKQMKNVYKDVRKLGRSRLEAYKAVRIYQHTRNAVKHPWMAKAESYISSIALSSLALSSGKEKQDYLDAIAKYGNELKQGKITNEVFKVGMTTNLF